MPPSAKTHFSSSVNVLPYMEYCIQCFGICHIFQFTIWDCCWCCFRILQRKSYWQKNGWKYRSCEKYPEWIFVNTFDIIMAETKPWHHQSFQSCERTDSPRPEWLLESNIWYPQYWIQKPFFINIITLKKMTLALMAGSPSSAPFVTLVPPVPFGRMWAS